MPDLHFTIDGVEPQRFAAAPALLFKLRAEEAPTPRQDLSPVHSVILRCQVRIEPARRRYSASEQERLLAVFGTPERWGQTLRPFLWTHASAVVPAFTGAGRADLAVPCTYDFSLAATTYFDALQGGEIPLCFLFSGTVFYEGPGGGLCVAQIPWDREANHRLPAETWRDLMDHYYPNGAWLRVRKDLFDSLGRYKDREGLTTREEALERLLAAAEGVPVP